MATLYDEIRSFAGDVADGTDPGNTGANYILDNGELQLIVDRFAYADTDASTGYSVDILKAALEYARAARLVRVETNPERARRFDIRVQYLQKEYVNNARRHTRSTNAPGSVDPPTTRDNTYTDNAVRDHNLADDAHDDIRREIGDFLTASEIDTAIRGYAPASNDTPLPVAFDTADVTAGDDSEFALFDHRHGVDTVTFAARVNALIAAHSSPGGLTTSGVQAIVRQLLADWAEVGNTDDVPISKLPTASSSTAGIIQAAEYIKINNAIDADHLHDTPNLAADHLMGDDAFLIDDASINGAGLSQLREISASELDKRWRELATANNPGDITAADFTKLQGIESGAQVNVGVEFTQGEKTKLAAYPATPPSGEDNIFQGVFAVAPAVANYAAGEVYFNSTDGRFYERIDAAIRNNTLTIANFTPAAVPSTPGNLQDSGFSVGRAVSYGTSPFTGWNELRLRLDSDAQGNTQFYLEAQTNQNLFAGLAIQVGATSFTFRRDSSTAAGGDIWTSNNVATAPWGFTSVALVVTCTNRPFTSTEAQWHSLELAQDDYNALTGVTLGTDNQLTFEQHTGPDHDIDLTQFKQASWATEGNTDFIPSAKIELTQTLIDGTGIGETMASGQTARGPLRLFSPTFDLDDTDKQHGIFYVRVNLHIVDADTTTSFSNSTVTRTLTLSSRHRASVMRQDSEEYSATVGTPGERIGDRTVRLFRGTTLVGRLRLLLSRNSDKELGYYVDWVRSSGSSSISFQLLNFSVEFTHNDTPAGGVSQDAEILNQLAQNATLTRNSNNVLTDLRYTVPADKAGRYLIEFKASVDIRGVTRQNGSANTQTGALTQPDASVMYMVVRGAGNKEYAFNAHVLIAPDGQRTLDAEGFGILAAGEILEPFVGFRGQTGSAGTGVVNSGTNSYLRLVYLG